MNKLLKLLQSKRKDKKGFTLMEMLIVVAIIAILVAIAVPSFNSSLETAKKAADEANMRTAKSVAAVMAADYLYDNSKDELAQGDYFDAENGTFTKDKPSVAYGKAKAHKEMVIYVVALDKETGEPTLDWIK